MVWTGRATHAGGHSCPGRHAHRHTDILTAQHSTARPAFPRPHPRTPSPAPLAAILARRPPRIAATTATTASTTTTPSASTASSPAATLTASARSLARSPGCAPAVLYRERRPWRCTFKAACLTTTPSPRQSPRPTALPSRPPT